AARATTPRACARSCRRVPRSSRENRSVSRHPRDAIVLGYVRTPVGRYGGALAHVRPDDLASHVIRAVLERTDIADREVDEVVIGASNQAGEDNRNLGRMAAL